jgi:hypothetical protein
LPPAPTLGLACSDVAEPNVAVVRLPGLLAAPRDLPCSPACCLGEPAFRASAGPAASRARLTVILTSLRDHVRRRHDGQRRQ